MTQKPANGKVEELELLTDFSWRFFQQGQFVPRVSPSCSRKLNKPKRSQK
ncbi:hypothetical protein [Calothrix sp. UHCC 0171]|nr:hypothetical protein [Calothrix sp. UHCC 0171]MEA5574431.1 hypothetical protein [Calothrix sp. UHCC 0171]